MADVDWIGATIASISAVVAVASAAYAKHQASAAQAANNIALVQHRLEVYDAVMAFFTAMRATRRPDAQLRSDVMQFGKVVGRTEFYFPEPLFERAQALFEGAIDLLVLHDDLAEAQAADVAAKLQQIEALRRRLGDGGYDLMGEMAKHLKVGVK